MPTLAGPPLGRAAPRNAADLSPPCERRSSYGIPGLVVGIGIFLFAWVRADWSPWETRQGNVIKQPVPFSHEHHVSGLGIDCRYCHMTVEVSSSAGMPDTHTCMTCHSQVWTHAPVLEPVRDSFREDMPIQWVRVYDLPDYVYFDHSIHVNRGVACETCHGRVDQMPITYKEHALYMVVG